MIIKQFGGYSVVRGGKFQKHGRVQKLYVRTIYGGRAGFVTDYSRAKVYKTRAAAQRVDRGLDAGTITSE